MNLAVNIILTVQILTAIGMVGLILIQHGKGADMGAAFGSGGSGSLFGASGSSNFLSRTTAVLAFTFFVTTLALAYYGGSRPASTGSVLESTVNAPAVPVTPASEIPAGKPSASRESPTTSANSVPPVTPITPATGAGQIPTK